MDEVEATNATPGATPDEFDVGEHLLRSGEYDAYLKDGEVVIYTTGDYSSELYRVNVASGEEAGALAIFTSRAIEIASAGGAQASQPYTVVTEERSDGTVVHTVTPKGGDVAAASDESIGGSK